MKSEFGMVVRLLLSNFVRFFDLIDFGRELGVKGEDKRRVTGGGTLDKKESYRAQKLEQRDPN